jgi:hypothetical protein
VLDSGLGKITFFPDCLDDRLDLQIKQGMESSTTEPKNEKQKGFHLLVLQMSGFKKTDRITLADAQTASCRLFCFPPPFSLIIILQKIVNYHLPFNFQAYYPLQKNKKGCQEKKSNLFEKKTSFGCRLSGKITIWHKTEIIISHNYFFIIKWL